MITLSRKILILKTDLFSLAHASKTINQTENESALAKTGLKENFYFIKDKNFS